MPPEPPDDREMALYLGGVVSLSALAILLLGTLFVTRIPEFTLAFVENPAAAVWADPIAVVLILGTIGALVALFGLVVAFGAKYGLAKAEGPHHENG